MRNSSIILLILIVFFCVCVLTSSAKGEYSPGRFNLSPSNYNSVPHGDYIWNNRGNQTIADMYPDSTRMGLLEGTAKFLGDSFNAVFSTIWSVFDNKKTKPTN